MAKTLLAGVLSGTSSPGAGWKVEDGILKKVANLRGGDIITEEKFSDFELSWEWRISPAGNTEEILRH
jgi:hypothetical protein